MSTLVNLLKLITGLSAALVLAACGMGGSGAEPTINVPTLAGHASVGTRMPLVNAKIEFQNAAGQKIEGLSAQTGSSGEYVLNTSGRELPRIIVAVSSGGSVGGEPMAGSLKALSYLASTDAAQISINPISTLAELWWRNNRSVSVEEAYRQANQALGLPVWTDHDAATRLLDDVMNSDALHTGAKAMGGFDKWAAQVVNQWAGGVASSYPFPENRPPRFWGALASIGWNVVSGAAAKCDPENNPVPGLGMLASAINSIGVVGTDPACETQKMLKGISSKIGEIKDQLSAMDVARAAQSSAIAGKLAELRGTVYEGFWTLAFRDFEEKVARPVRVVQDATTSLADVIGSYTQDTGLTLDQLMGAVADSSVATSNYSNSDLKEMANDIKIMARSIKTYYTMPTWFDSRDYADTMLWDRPEVPDTINALHNAWKAINKREFVDASQQAAFAAVVEYFRQYNILRALQHIDYLRSEGLSTRVIVLQMNKWSPKDEDFERMMPTMLPWNRGAGRPHPLDPIPGPVRGANLGYKPVAPAGPVIDPVSGLMWISACTQYFNGNGFNVDSNEACPYAGMMGATQIWDGEPIWPNHWREFPFQIRLPGQGNLRMVDAGPGWFYLASKLSPTDPFNVSGFARPSIAQMQTLRKKAMDNGQDGEAIATWLANESSPNSSQTPAVFAGLTRRPAWTSVWYQLSKDEELVYVDSAIKMFNVKDGGFIMNAPRLYVSRYFDKPNSTDYRPVDRERYFWDSVYCGAGFSVKAGNCKTVPAQPTNDPYSRQPSFYDPNPPSPYDNGILDLTEWSSLGGYWKPFDPKGVALGVLQLTEEQLKCYVPSTFTRSGLAARTTKCP